MPDLHLADKALQEALPGLAAEDFSLMASSVFRATGDLQRALVRILLPDKLPLAVGRACFWKYIRLVVLEYKGQSEQFSTKEASLYCRVMFFEGVNSVSVSPEEPAVQGSDPFAPLYPYQFISLLTFRQSGEGVPTTVWFASDEQGFIYVVSQIKTGKIKRLRRNSKVQMTPTDSRGALLDRKVLVSGFAREIEGELREHAIDLLEKKYGEEYSGLMRTSGGSHSPTRTYIRIVSQAEQL